MESPSRWQDRFEIEQTLFRYARGVDRKEWELVRSVYHPDAIDDHGAYSGGVDGFLDFLKTRHRNIEQSLHLITNIIIEFRSPDAALVESYFICYQRLASTEKIEKGLNAVALEPGQTLQVVSLGRYIDRFERRDSRWAVSGRKVAYDVLETHATPLRGGLNPAWIASKRDRGDVLFEDPAAAQED
jgi:hypothetical protein